MKMYFETTIYMDPETAVATGEHCFREETLEEAPERERDQKPTGTFLVHSSRSGLKAVVVLLQYLGHFSGVAERTER